MKWDRTLDQSCLQMQHEFQIFFDLLMEVGIQWCFLLQAEMLADVPAAEVAVLEDERMAGNMQATLNNKMLGTCWNHWLLSCIWITSLLLALCRNNSQ